MEQLLVSGTDVGFETQISNYKSTDFFRIFLCLFLRGGSTKNGQKMLYVAG
jgi:hypothetical protein